MMESHCGVPASAGGCPVPPPPHIDPAEHDEGKTMTEKLLEGPMKDALECVRQKAKAAGVPFNLESGYRSSNYQRHFYDLINGYMKLLRNRNPACDAVRKLYQKEMEDHGLKGPTSNPDKPGSSQHPQKNAVDMNLSPELAACCNLWERYGDKDDGHFELCKPEINCDPCRLPDCPLGGVTRPLHCYDYEGIDNGPGRPLRP
jgi:hypothetical protein